MKDWLPDYHACDLPLKEELLAMHPRTMDRYLKGARSDLRRRLNTGTRAGKLIITKVPLKNFGGRPTCPGHYGYLDGLDGVRVHPKQECHPCQTCA